MLESKVRSREEVQQYLKELSAWIEQERDTPIEQMSDFFNQRVAVYDGVHLSKWPNEYQHIADFFAEDLSSLLDLGCGTGLELESIFKRFPKVQVTGIDLSTDMLKSLLQKYLSKDLTLINDDYFTVPLGQEKFGAALSFMTLHHFSYEKKLRLYQKIYEALKKDGYYIEVDYLAENEMEELLCQNFARYKRRKFHVPENTFIHIDTPLTFQHQKKLLLTAGFKNVQILHQNEGLVLLKALK